MDIGKAIDEINNDNDKRFEAKGISRNTVFIKMVGSFKGYTDVIVI